MLPLRVFEYPFPRNQTLFVVMTKKPFVYRYTGKDREVLPVVRVLEALLGSRSSDARLPIEALRLDPKLKTQVKLGGPGSPSDVNAAGPAGGTPFRAAIVFMVGGGCVGEYQEIQKWARHNRRSGQSDTGLRRQVIYGTTDVVSPQAMLQQLGKIGKQML